MPNPTNRKLTIKQQAWLKHYFDTFNATEAAARAGYNGNRITLNAIGNENIAKLSDEIKEYADKVLLSDDKIKAKISNGLEAMETKFFACNGIVTDEREVEALDIQRKYTHMAAKVKGLYAPEKHDISGTMTVLEAPKVNKKAK